MSQLITNNNISSYIDNNRTKLDEALVSLRFMKQIDDFLAIHNLNQKDLAYDLNVSAAFISQLMAGTKKINTPFINKFEKKYDVEFKLMICYNNSQYSITEGIPNPIKLKAKVLNFVESSSHYTSKSNAESRFVFSSTYTDTLIIK
jgi:transcriptional regulator with XRE-family HTH domain